MAQVAVCALLVVVLWATTRPYQGFAHDAQLYLVQALHWLDPSGFAADLFFAYGSQDAYSVSSALYAPLVAVAGPSRAHLVALVLGHAFWLAALWFMALVLFGRGDRAMAAVVAVIVMVPIYNSGALQYGELVATPRVPVEALSMAAIAAICMGRGLVAGAILICAFALHPVMTLPTLALVAMMRFRWSVLVVAAVAGLGVVLGLGFAGIDPFMRILERMDPAWFGVVHARTPAAFVPNWILQGLVLSVVPVVSAGLVAVYGGPVPRRLARVVLVLAPTLVLVGWVAGEKFADLLVLNLQLWRSLWLLMLLGNCLVPAAYAILPREGRGRALFLAAVAANVCEARFGFAALPFASAALSIAALCAAAATRGPMRHRGIARVASSGMTALATLLFLGEIAAVALQPHAMSALDVLQRCVLVFVAGALLLAIARHKVRLTLPVLALVAGTVVWTAAIVDQRNDRMVFLSGNAPVDPAFVAALEGRTVYWEGGPEFLWFRLRQPSYFSCYQAAGAMFFRETAMEHARRAAVLRGLNTADFSTKADDFCPQRADPLYEGPASVLQLQEVCRALPELDALVLRADLPDVPHLRWRPGFDVPASGLPVPPKNERPVYVKGKPVGSLNLYRCDDLR